MLCTAADSLVSVVRLLVFQQASTVDDALLLQLQLLLIALRMQPAYDNKATSQQSRTAGLGFAMP